MKHLSSAAFSKRNFAFGMSPLALLTLTACGGGGGGGSTSSGATPSVSVGGSVVKGPLSNALVGLDYDGDGVVDSATVRTDANGGYSISTSNATYTVIAVADDSTVDTSSGTVFSGVTLKAPKGATVVTPTTTLMEEGNLTATQVASVLGLPDGVDPLTFNPFAAGVSASDALAVEKASQQVMSVVNAFASAAEGAGATEAAAYTAALNSIVEVVKTKAATSGSLDLTNTADLALIKTQAKTEMASTSGVNTTAFDALADDTATAIKNVNDKIATVSDLTSDASKNIFSTTQVLADQVKTAAAAEASSAGSGSSSITFTDSSVVNTAASNKAPTNIALSSSAISEAASSLVIGTLTTTDSDQTAGVKPIYALAEVAGSDHAAFSINQATGELSLKAQPDFETKSSYSVTILSTDEGGKTFSKTFSISIGDANDAPTVANAIADQTIAEDSALSFQFASNVFADVDAGDSFTYKATLSDGSALPSWLAFNAATRTFSGTPLNGDVGTIAVKVTATDSGSAAISDTFNLTVTNTNDAPTVINPIEDGTATEGVSYVWQFDANVFEDVDVGDSLTYTATLEDGSDLPDWLTFDADNLRASGTPPNSAVGVIVGKLTATDTSGASASDIVALTVVNTNDAPTVANAIADQTIAEDSALSFQFASNVFADVDAGDSFTYKATLSDGSALPSWLAFNAATRTFSGTPLNGDVGTIAVKVTATDSGSAAISDTFNLTVTNTNDAPTVINPIEDGTATEGVSYVWQFDANVFEDVDVGDSLTYTATLEDGSDLPDWLTFDADNLRASGTPPNSAVGVIVGKLTATDTSGASASDIVALTVVNTNNAPTVANAIADQTIAEDSALSFQFASNVFADVDAGDSFTYTAILSDGSALPSWLSFNAGTRTFSGTPLNADVGAIDVKVTATDGGSAAVTDTFKITVTNTNDAPTVANAISDQTIAEDSALSFQFNSNVFADVDAGDSFTYTATLADGSALPSWLAFDADTRTFSGTPLNADVGAIDVKVTATDGGSAAVTDSFQLTVTNTNDAPTGAVTISGTATQGQVLTAVSTLADVDGIGTLAYQWSEGGVAISGATSSTLTLGQSQVGKAITVAVSYTDGGGTVETEVSSATSAVANINDDPTGAVTISGSSSDGSIILLANTSDVTDPDGLGDFSYQWKADGSSIPFEDSSILKTSEELAMATITLDVTYFDKLGTFENITSNPLDLGSLTGELNRNVYLIPDQLVRTTEIDGLSNYDIVSFQNLSVPISVDLGAQTRINYVDKPFGIERSVLGNSIDFIRWEDSGFGEADLRGVEQIIATAHNDNAIAINNRTRKMDFDLGGGDDTLLIGPWLSSDIIDGGAGDDTIKVYVAGFNVNLNAQTMAKGSSSSKIVNFENIYFIQSGIFTGDDAANIIQNESSFEIIERDVLQGGGGFDTLDGGGGDDLYYVTDLKHYFPGEILDSGTSGVDELRFDLSVESSVKLGAADDVIEIVSIGSGFGSTPDRSSTVSVNIDASDLLRELTIHGSSGSNAIIGTRFSDTIHGYGGRDSLTGGMGDDKYFGLQLGDSVSEGPGQGIDTAYSDNLKIMPDNVERLIIQQSATGIDFHGNAMGNYIFVEPSNVVRTIHGNEGNDFFVDRGESLVYGGEGDDFFHIIDGSPTSIADFEPDIWDHGRTSQGEVYNYISEHGDSLTFSASLMTGINYNGKLADKHFLSQNNASGEIYSETLDHRILYNLSTGELFNDEDGSGPIQKTLIATLENKPVLQTSDFFLLTSSNLYYSNFDDLIENITDW